ncbi:MAG: hypothetical protein ACXIUQ_18690 [Cecembia sp.]
MYKVQSTKYHVPSTKYHVPCTKYKVPSKRLEGRQVMLRNGEM